MFVYIAGDSFCSERHSQEHWPWALSHLLGAELRGQGFPGQGWWNTRKHLLEYSQSPEFSSTQAFVICHTSIDRPVMTLSNKDPGFDDCSRVYYAYMANDEISAWQARHWYREINDILKDRLVLHIPCFRTGLRLQDELMGLRVTTPLINFSQTGHEWANHLSPDQNRALAQQLAAIIEQRSPLTQLTL